MSKIVQWKRGNTIVNSTYTGADGEITVNTDSYTLIVHDGVTQGGIQVQGNTTVTAVTDITYANLRTLVESGNLTPVSFYRITDYATIYDQPDFYANGDPKTTVATLTGNVEPLVVKAVSSNSLGLEAWSQDYPYDMIHYDINFVQTERMAAPAKGRITYRVDENSNSTNYDMRNVVFKRYESSPGSMVYTSVYDTGGANISLPTFGANCFNNVIGDIYTELHTPPKDFILPNNVFGEGCYDNTTGDDCFNNTIGDGAAENTVASHFHDNVIGSGFVSNEINQDFQFNVIGDNCNKNIIGHGFAYNNIGSGMINNHVLSNFAQNTIRDGFYLNSISAGFVSNFIGNNFSRNEVAVEFNNNPSIGDQFANNTIGTGFTQNNIGLNFADNIIEGLFAGQTIGNSFTNTSLVYGLEDGTKSLYAGLPFGFADLPDVVVQFSANVASYAQVNFQNINTDPAASTDIVATADNGTDATFFTDHGITAAAHLDPAFFGDTGTGNDAYLYVVGYDSTGPSLGNVGNLIVGSTNGHIKMFVGNTAQANVVATVSQEQFTVNASTSSTSITTGALVVGGGIGASGNVFIGNILALSPTTKTYVSSTIPLDLNKAVNKLTPKTITGTPHYSLANGTEGQLMYIVPAGTIGASEHTVINIANVRYSYNSTIVQQNSKSWRPFGLMGSIPEASSASLTLIFTDGYWNVPHGLFD